MEKILVFGMTENPGGVESVIMNYYRYLDKSKIQFDFLSNSKNIAYEEEIESLGGKVFKITARKDDFRKFRYELDCFMKNNARFYSAIWVNICSLVNIDYLIYAKKYGIAKRIIHCHNSDNDAGKLKRIVHEWNKKRIGKYATHFWSCSDSASQWFFNKIIINSKNYKVIPNAIEVERFLKNDEVRANIRKKYDLENKIVIGHVGRFHFQKNHKFLIEVFNELLKKNDKYQLLLVGQGNEEATIKSMVAKYGIENNVTFCGVRDDVETFYQAMDCFVLPSIFEGLGIVALEAQACSLPCLLSDEVPKVVKVNDNVFFYSLNNTAHDWACEIERILAQKDCNTENRMLHSKYNIKLQIDEFERAILEK